MAPFGVWLEAAFAKDLQHTVIFGQHVSDEGQNALLAGVRGKPLQEQRAQALALEGVVDEEGHLGRVPAREAHVPADRQGLLLRTFTPSDEIGHAPDSVNVDHPLQVAPLDVLRRREEAEPQGLARRAAEQRVEPLDVIRPSRSYPGRGPVTEDNGGWWRQNGTHAMSHDLPSRQVL